MESGRWKLKVILNYIATSGQPGIQESLPYKETNKKLLGTYTQSKTSRVVCVFLGITNRGHYSHMLYLPSGLQALGVFIVCS